MKATFKIDGMDKLKRDLGKLGKVPQKHVTSAARKGMNIALKSARGKAPVDDGDLKKGIVLSGEKSRYKGKKVYQVTFDSKMNDVFQKTVENVGESGSPNAKDPAYYPASQEYGYFLRNGRYMPGLAFMHHALNSNAPKIAKTMVDTMTKKIEDEARKVGLK